MSSGSDLDGFIARSVSTHQHPAGTCRMGNVDQSVVDATLAVHGVPGHYVVDAAMFPSLTSGPIHAAVIAVAEIWCGMMQSS